MSVVNILNAKPHSSNFGSTFTLTSIPLPTEPPPVQAPIVEKDESISYTELTKVHIDAAARKKASEFTKKRFDNKQTISVRDARIVNLNAKTEIIKLSPEMVERFPIDRFIRKRLSQMKNLKKCARDLGFAPSNLHEFSAKRSKNISKEQADIYNKYFEEQNLGNGSKIFDLERIFQFALTEPISQNTSKICEKIFIRVEGKHHEQLRELPRSARRTVFFQQRLRSVIRAETKKLSLKDVVVINKISEKTIFKLNKEAVERIPVLPEHIEELKSLKMGKEINGQIQNAISQLTCFAPPQTISLEMAEEINSLLGIKVFDVDSLFAKAIQEAQEEAASVVPFKKRPSSDISSPSEADEPSPKKQRITDDSTETARPQLPSFAELDTALFLQRLAESHAVEVHLTATLPT